MLSLPLPPFDAEATFRLCISKIRNPNLKERLDAVAGHVAQRSEMFATAAQRTQLHQFPQPSVAGLAALGVTGAELVAVYDYRMVDSDGPGRPVYDSILASAPHGQCLLCAHRDASTLDHHLPKTKFPDLSVAPANLIPACADCNHVKSTAAPSSSEEETIHPYFDRLDADRWLFAKIEEGRHMAASFGVIPPPTWPPLTTERLKNHFRTFRLGRLYRAQAATEHSTLRLQLTRLHLAGGAAAVRTQLQERHESCEAARSNSWQTALYDALAASDWYCETGHAL